MVAIIHIVSSTGTSGMNSAAQSLQVQVLHAAARHESASAALSGWDQL